MGGGGAVPRTSMDSEDNCTFELHKAFSSRSLNWCAYSQVQRQATQGWAQPMSADSRGVLRILSFTSYKNKQTNWVLFELYTICSLTLKQHSFCFVFFLVCFSFVLFLFKSVSSWPGMVPVSLSPVSGSQERKTTLQNVAQAGLGLRMSL